ncbi:uncharacterized protein [Venturia canescens]|uniref:uncharacterized protein n=1 Tax=Venturia canescens TaxID=32260 RepID=UPI001C9D1920|nr:uncharacterized protein LOC122409642 [Venturia canescens]
MSCFGGTVEQLYLLELTIDKLRLPAEKFKDVACVDGADCSIVVKVKFLDFPTFEISQRDFYFAKASPRDSEGSLDFSSGRACLFVKQPRDLVREMQNKPLKIGIFCAGDTYPIAETEVPLAGCLCDQISMAANDRDHLPPSYTIKGNYSLTDPGENPSGTIDLGLKVSCLGKSVTTHYQLNPKSFYFKNDGDDSKYYVKRILPPSSCADEAGEGAIKCGDSMLPRIRVDEELEQVTAKKPNDAKINDKVKAKKGKKDKKKAKKQK